MCWYNSHTYRAAVAASLVQQLKTFPYGFKLQSNSKVQSNEVVEVRLCTASMTSFWKEWYYCTVQGKEYRHSTVRVPYLHKDIICVLTYLLYSRGTGGWQSRAKGRSGGKECHYLIALLFAPHSVVELHSSTLPSLPSDPRTHQMLQLTTNIPAIETCPRVCLRMFSINSTHRTFLTWKRGRGVTRKQRESFWIL